MGNITFQTAHALFNQQKYADSYAQFLFLADQMINPAFCTFMAGKCRSFMGDMLGAFTCYQKAVTFDDSNAFINREIEHTVVMNNLLEDNAPLIMHYAPHTTNIGDSGSIAGIRMFINTHCEDCVFLSLSCRKDVFPIWKDMFQFTSLIVIGGGGLFFQQPLPSGWYFPLSLDELMSIPTPAVTYAVGFNQEFSSESAWHHDDTFLNAIAAFHGCFTQKSVRDEWSRDLLEKKGITDVSLVPCPSAFLEPLPWFKLPFDESKKVVCIAPTDRSMTESERAGLVSTCTAVARWLSDNGYCPLIVFHDSYDDMQLATLLARNDLLCFLPNTAREAITVYSKAEAVIGMRGHSLILAAGQCIPVLGISYNKKVDALMELLSLQDYCLPKTCIEDPQRIILSFNKLQENGLEIKNTLQSKKNLFLKANMEYSRIIAQHIT